MLSDQEQPIVPAAVLLLLRPLLTITGSPFEDRHCRADHSCTSMIKLILNALKAALYSIPARISRQKWQHDHFVPLLQPPGPNTCYFLVPQQAPPYLFNISLRQRISYRFTSPLKVHSTDHDSDRVGTLSSKLWPLHCPGRITVSADPFAIEDPLIVVLFNRIFTRAVLCEDSFASFCPRSLIKRRY